VINPFNVVRDFEAALCEYTDAPFAVTTTSCTAALTLAVAYHFAKRHQQDLDEGKGMMTLMPPIEIPKRTYVSVPMAIIHAGGRPTFRDEEWVGSYQLKPLPVWDSARWMTSGMYNHGMMWPTDEAPAHHHGMVCVSFHWSKTLGIQQGGAILHDNPEADKWLRQARFDGRIEGVSPRYQAEAYGFKVLGWHCYMSPEVAAQGLVRLGLLPKHNAPLKNDDYPDLSQIGLFK